MNVLYTTSAVSVGGRDGHVKNADGQIDMDLKTPGAKEGRVGTTPEDLFAAGYAACFNSALNHVMRLQRIRPEGDSVITVEISMGTTESGNFQLAATIKGHIPGMEESLVEALMEEAHQVCPYSRATRGNIDVVLQVI